MKKKAILFVFRFILTIQLASASLSYSCLNGTKLYESTKEMNEGSIKLIEGINIALIEADESNALGKMMAEVFIDSQEITLPNLTSIEHIKLTNTEYALKIINTSSEQMLLSVNSVSATLEKKEMKKINNLWIFLKDFQGTYPNIADINIIAGSYETILSNDENPFENFSINSTNYLIELISASDSDATISLKRCEGSAVFRKEQIKKPVLQNKSHEQPLLTAANNSQTQNQSNSTSKTEPLQPQKECNILGAINESNYCNETGNYAAKKEKGMFCANNYECISIKCKLQKCADFGFFEKLWKWIKGLI